MTTETLITLPKLKSGTMRIVPLGGLGEIGRNMTVFELNGKLLLVDCGVLFPEEEQPGVDLILPDFSYIEDRLDDVVGLVLTHGHEDHIGAVPYLLRKNDQIPLIGSRLTLALIEAKLAEHRIKPYTLTVEEGAWRASAPSSASSSQSTTPSPTPGRVHPQRGRKRVPYRRLQDGPAADGRPDHGPPALRPSGEEGVDLFLSDSTNAHVPGFTAPEKNIGPVIESYFRDSERRIIVASFASHIHRVQQVLDAAHKHGRKVAFVGRSMVRNMGIADKLGYLDVPEGLLVDIKKVDDVPDHKLVLMSTGSQGEPMAALSRMANGDHQVQVGEGDTIILASSLIPGNETSVYRVINGLMKTGADVVHKDNANVHVSGHASAGELLYCYNILKPRNVMPVHGETRHLIANGRLAEETGVLPDSVLLCEDGSVVDLRDGQARITGQIECGYVYVDGSSIGEITDTDLKDRRTLGEEGFISVITVVNRQTGTIVSGPDIHARGVAEEDAVFKGIKPKIEKALIEAIESNKEHTTHQLQQVVRRTIGSWVSRKLRRKPMIVPVVVET